MTEYEHVTLELKCCCCGKVLDTLPTGWFTAAVAVQPLWTRDPCEPCERRLAYEEQLRGLPADLQETLLALWEKGVDVDLAAVRPLPERW